MYLNLKCCSFLWWCRTN